MSIAQSVEAPATVNDRFIVGGSLMAENGIGSGGLSLTWRRLLGSSMWAEVGLNNRIHSLLLLRKFSCENLVSLLKFWRKFIFKKILVINIVIKKALGKILKLGLKLSCAKTFARQLS